MNNASILFKLIDVTVKGNGRDILRNISIDIDASKAYAFVGSSGAGKTTLLSLFNALIIPSSGEILYKGNSLLSLDLRDHRREVSLVQQEPVLLENKVYNEILLPFKYNNREKPRIDEIIEVMNTASLGEDMLYKECSTLSGGEKKRVAIARSLIVKPSVLLLDEPSSGLDMVHSANLFSNLFALNPKPIILFTSHRIDDIKYAQIIVLIKDGCLIKTTETLQEDELREFLKEEDEN